jgi:hypothetical protein
MKNGWVVPKGRIAYVPMTSHQTKSLENLRNDEAAFFSTSNFASQAFAKFLLLFAKYDRFPNSDYDENPVNDRVLVDLNFLSS